MTGALSDERRQHKMVLVVRRDLKMGVGKIAAQCAHAALGMYRHLMATDPKQLQSWLAHGQAKIVCKVETGQEMMLIADKARDKSLPVYVVTDAGHTQVECGSQTVLAVGPGEAGALNGVTGHLKLL
jgi:PTH2 family peptidyl-tRNA hydrolase